MSLGVKVLWVANLIFFSPVPPTGGQCADMKPVLLRSAPSPREALLNHFQANKKPDSQVIEVEVQGEYAYVAVCIRGITQAFVSHFSELSPAAFGHDLVLGQVQHERDNPDAAMPSSTFLKLLTPAPLFLEGCSAQWREQATENADWEQRALGGEVLLGRYSGAQGYVSYNEQGKKEFEKDARHYLGALAKALGWPPAERNGRSKTGITFCEGGPAVSGEIYLRLQLSEKVEVMVEISASGGMCGPKSPGGAGIMWRFEGQSNQHRERYFHPNQWPRWDMTVREFAEMIRKEARRLKLLALQAA